MTDPFPYRIRVAAGVAFACVLPVWTYLLLEPKPVPEELKRSLASWSSVLPFLLAKCLHAVGYAFLGLLASVWPPTRRWRWVVIAFVLMHGVGTEIGQTFVPNRTGKVADVFIDWTGTTIGVLVAWAARWLVVLQPRRGDRE